VIAFVWICSLTVTSAQSAGTGVITGKVIDALTGRALAGATVSVDGLTLSTQTDRDGQFRLPSIPAGARTIITTYLGRKDTRTAVQVAAGGVATASVRLDAERVREQDVVVTADLIKDAQTRALNQQKTAPNITNVVSADQIGNFPDPNAAEVTQRIPGVSIQRDQGEGRYVIIRGTEPRLNSMLINGERIPAPEADVRQVALDVIPADLLQAVEVSKALTPDMDGDAIGGAVNLVTKKALDKFMVFGSVGGGFNTSLDSYDQRNSSVTLGRRFGGGKVGFVLGASANATKRGNQDFEPVYTAGALTDLDLRRYTVNRRRNGLTTSVDVRPTATSQYTISGIYNYFIDDHEERQRWRNRLANSRLERELRDRTHVERIWNLSFAGHHDLGSTSVEYHLQGARSDQEDPGTIATTFRQSNVTFLPNVTPTSIDPDNVQANPQNENLAAYTFNQQVQAINSNVDRDIVGAVDVRRLMHTTQGLTAFIKGGMKFRDKDKARTRDEVTLTVPSGSPAIPLSAVLQAGAATQTILDGRYTFGPFISLPTASGLQSTTTFTSAVNHARDSEDSTTGERVGAGYVMAELFVGPKLYIMPGVRVERFSADYVGFDVQFAPNGAWLSTTPLSGSSEYTNVLPGAHARYAVTPDLNIRAAVTRTLARPNYISLIPSRTFDDQNNRITIGNATLRPTLSWNTDVMVERYLKSVGVLSAGVFYKKLHDYIYTFVSTDTINGELFTITQPLNGAAASVTGVEFAAQNQLTFLPAPFDGLGVYVNYTFTDSTAVFPGRTGEQSTLPGQSRHVGNVSVSYEKAGFSGRVAVNFHGSYVDVVGASTGLDRFYDTHKQMDFSVVQKITPNIRAYFNALNLTDAPLRYFEGVTTRPLQEEHYRWWAEFGVKVNWSAR